jgi:hypothetical protein
MLKNKRERTALRQPRQRNLDGEGSLMGKKRQIRVVGKYLHTDSRHLFKIRDMGMGISSATAEQRIETANTDWRSLYF